MHGNLLHLRALEPADADILYVWENDPALWECGSRQWPVSHADVGQLIAQSDMDVWQTRQLRLMMQTHAGAGRGATVGCVDLFDFDPLNLHVSVGIVVDAAFRRRGYAREALGLAEQFAFQTLMARSVEATVEDGNDASLALFRSCGYQEVGRRKDWIRHGSAFSDQIIMQKLSPLSFKR